jgi:hypothetical protein
MDIKRTILIVALAIVTYVGVLKWNQDYGQAALPTQNVAASTNNAALPDTPQGTTAANADVPSATGEVVAPADAPVAASKDLIQVKTDVLNLEIDPVGGDVVQLRLPLYPRRQDHPEIPFQLPLANYLRYQYFFPALGRPDKGKYSVGPHPKYSDLARYFGTTLSTTQPYRAPSPSPSSAAFLSSSTLPANIHRVSPVAELTEAPPSSSSRRFGRLISTPSRFLPTTCASRFNKLPLHTAITSHQPTAFGPE